MERTDITRLLGVLKAAWPDRPINEETVTAYEMAWSDLPFELGQGAVAEHLRTGKFFPAPSEIRELALRAGVGLPAAEIAWQEAQRVTSGYRPGDAPPVWSSKVLEDTVAAVGWGAIKMCDADNVGTLRAQFRDTYNALLKQMAAENAHAALEEADDRREMLAFLRRPRPEPTPITHSRPMALPAAPVRALEAGEEPGEPWALRKFRLRFEARQPKGNPMPNSKAILQSLPAWNALPEEYRAELLKRHADKEEDAR